VNLASRNPDLPDVALAPAMLNLAAQVNNFAKTDVALTAGSGSLARNLTAFTLDFGSILQTSGVLTAKLAIQNNIPGFEPGDLLDVSFLLSSVDGFELTGFTAHQGIAPGDFFDVLVSFDSSMALGAHAGDVLIHSLGHNASGFAEALPDLTLALRAEVVGDLAPIPEPGTLQLFVLGAAVLGALTRYRRIARR